MRSLVASVALSLMVMPGNAMAYEPAKSVPIATTQAGSTVIAELNCTLVKVCGDVAVPIPGLEPFKFGNVCIEIHVCTLTSLLVIEKKKSV